MFRSQIILLALSILVGFALTPSHHHQQLTFSMPSDIRERTFIMVKPDGVQRALVGNIISRFEVRGFKLIAMKMIHATSEHLEKRLLL